MWKELTIHDTFCGFGDMALEASQALQPFASGHYINEIDIEATPQKAADCFSVKAWNRLADVRHRYDPERLFHGFLGVA